MPPWLGVALGVLGAVLGLTAAVHAMLERQTRLILAELGRTVFQHIAECPARTRAIARDDDSGEFLTPRTWSASGKTPSGSQ